MKTSHGAAAALALALLWPAIGYAARKPHAEAEGKLEAAEAAQQAAEARNAPGYIQPGAYSAAFASLSGLGVSGMKWKEVTTRPYNADDPR